MEKFDTIQGKLFYAVYMMYKSNQINENVRGRLKDMIVSRDPSLSEIRTDSPRMRQTLIELGTNSTEGEDTSTKQTTRPSPRGYSTRPKIQIGSSNKLLGSKSLSSLNCSPLQGDQAQKKQVVINQIA